MYLLEGLSSDCLKFSHTTIENPASVALTNTCLEINLQVEIPKHELEPSETAIEEEEEEHTQFVVDLVRLYELKGAKKNSITVEPHLYICLLCVICYSEKAVSIQWEHGITHLHSLGSHLQEV